MGGPTCGLARSKTCGGSADAGVQEVCFPISANARSLPFADEFFDAVVSVDSFMFYGTDDLYMNYPRAVRKTGRARGNRTGGSQRGA